MICSLFVATIWLLEVDMRTETVRLRVDLDEKRSFQDAADLAGVPLSAWVRERLRKAARLELEAAGRQIAFLQRLRKAD